MSFVLAFVVMSLLAITAYSFMNNAEAFQGLLVVLGSFAITYTIFWFQSGRVWLQAVALAIVSALTFLFVQLISPATTIPVLSGIIAAGMIEIVFEVLFGFIANNIRKDIYAAANEYIAKTYPESPEAPKAEEKKDEKAATQPVTTAKPTAPAQQAATQPAVSQSKIVAWMVGLVFSAIAEKEDTPNDKDVKSFFAKSLVEAAMAAFNQLVRNQKGDLRKILTETLKAGYVMWFDQATVEVETAEEANFEIETDDGYTILLAVKPNELNKPTPTVDAAIAAETPKTPEVKVAEKAPEKAANTHYQGRRVGKTPPQQPKVIKK